MAIGGWFTGLTGFFKDIGPMFNVLATTGSLVYEFVKQNEVADRMDQQRRDEAAALKVAQEERKLALAQEQKRDAELQAKTEEEARRRAAEESRLATQQNLIREKFINNREGTIREIEDSIKEKTDYLYDRIDDQFEGRKEQIAEDTTRAIQRVRHNPRQIEKLQTGKQNQLNVVEQEKLAAQRDLSLQVSGQAEQVFSSMQGDAYNALNVEGSLVDRQNAASNFLLGSRQGFIQKSAEAADKVMQINLGGIQAKSQAFMQGEAIKAQGYVNPFYAGKKVSKTLADDLGKLKVDDTPSWQSQAIDEAVDRGVKLGDPNTIIETSHGRKFTPTELTEYAVGTGGFNTRRPPKVSATKQSSKDQ